MSSKSRLSNVGGDKPQAFAARLDPDVYNAAATYANATHVSMNTIVNDALTFYLASGQAQAAYVSPVIEKTHGDSLRAAVDKLSGD